MKILTRAKSLCYDEYLISDSVMYKHNNLYLKVKGKWRECDETTRSLNFEDMLDRQGNKIFASLSEDGKGGDKMLRGVDMEQYGLKNTYYTAVCTRGSVLLKELSESTSISFVAYGFLKELKVIGIQE